MTTLSFEQLLNVDNLRKLAARTVETYPTAWKVVHEALQNAKDAVRRSQRQGSISILLDVAEQRVTVKDDGNGFPRDTDLLGFGGTDKDTDEDWALNGRQGVGLKAVILSTSFFKIDATTNTGRWGVKISGADTFIDGGEPVFEISDLIDSDESLGTTVSYIFSEPLVSQFVNEVLSQQLPYISEIFATNPVERIAMAFETYFRSYSYAGDVNSLLGIQSPIPTDVQLTILASGPPTGNLPSELLTILEQGRVESKFRCKHWDVIEAVDRTKAGRPRPTVLTQALPPGGLLGRFNENFIYRATLASPAEYQSLLVNPNLRRPINEAKYQRLFEQLRGLYVVIGSRAALLKYLVGPPRQFISADGTPTAHVLPGPTRGGDASYVSNNIHFVANVDARLNYGKQTISNPWLVGMVAEYFSDAVRATLRNVAISLVGSNVSTTSADDIEDTSGTETDVLSRPTLAEGHLSFKRVPRDENALIAIFFELIGCDGQENCFRFRKNLRAGFNA
ncbi:MAG: ATP-binding protein [Planctomycetes bacterium]|nr:ATP-binding protein [Planctomycetota bacterium]